MPFKFLNDPETSAPSDQIEPDARDFEIMLAAVGGTAGSGYGQGPTGVESGADVTAQGTPDQTVAVAAGVVRIGGRRVAVTGGNVSLSAADATNPRIDLITVDTAGAKSVTDGTAAADPVYPALPAGKVILAQVFRAANDNAIATADITDKRVIVPRPPWEDVTWYGADQTGSADSYAGIDAAWLAAKARAGSNSVGTIFFPSGPGTYKTLSQLTWYSRTDVVAAPHASLDYRGSYLSDAVVVTENTGGQNIHAQHWYGLGITGGYSTGPTFLADYGLKFAQGSGKIDFRTVVFDCHFQYFGKAAIIAVQGSTNWHMRRVRFDHCTEYAIVAQRNANADQGFGIISIEEFEMDNTNAYNGAQAQGFFHLDNTLADANTGPTPIHFANGLLECNRLATTTTTDGQTLPQTSINVADCSGFPSSGVVYIQTGDQGKQRVAYTGKTGSTVLTGCTGGTGTYISGGAVAGKLVAKGALLTITEPTTGTGVGVMANVNAENVSVAMATAAANTFPYVDIRKSDGTAGTPHYVTIQITNSSAPKRILAYDLNSYVETGEAGRTGSFTYSAKYAYPTKNVGRFEYGSVQARDMLTPPTGVGWVPPLDRYLQWTEGGVVKFADAGGHVKELTGWFPTSGVVSGLQVTQNSTGTQNVDVAAGAAIINRTEVVKASASTLAATAADASLPRWDAVEINTSGTVQWRQGYTGAAPELREPSTGWITIARIYRPPNDNTITTDQIYDMRGTLVPAAPDYPVAYEHVEKYGAVGDGSTDDTTAINNAITAAYNNGKNEVRFDGGKTYAHASAIDWKAGVFLRGGQGYAGVHNMQTTLLCTAGTPLTTGQVRVTAAGSGWLAYQRAESLRFDANDKADYCVEWVGTAGRADFGSYFAACNFVRPNKSGIFHAAGVTNWHIRDCRFDYCPDYAIELVPVSGREVIFFTLDKWTFDTGTGAADTSKGVILLDRTQGTRPQVVRIANGRVEVNTTTAPGLTEGVIRLVQPVSIGNVHHFLTLDNIVMALPSGQRDQFYVIKARESDATDATLDLLSVNAHGLDLETKYIVDCGTDKIDLAAMEKLPWFVLSRYDGATAGAKGKARLFSPLYLREQTAPGTPGANEVALYAKDNAGTSGLYYKNDAGAEVALTAGSFPGYGAAGYPLDVAATESDGTASLVARSDHRHALVEPMWSDAHVAAAIGGVAGTGYGQGPTGVESGCAVTAQGTPDQTVAVAAGVARVGGRRVTVASGNVSMAAADGTNPRWDLVTVDASGTKAAQSGTAAANPAIPTPTAGTVAIERVFRAANDNTIQTADITDARVIVEPPPYEDVTWYGAAGNDTGDQAAGIQAAMNAAKARVVGGGRQTVYFPPSDGSWRVLSQITWPAYVNVVGENATGISYQGATLNDAVIKCENSGNQNFQYQCWSGVGVSGGVSGDVRADYGIRFINGAGSMDFGGLIENAYFMQFNVAAVLVEGGVTQFHSRRIRADHTGQYVWLFKHNGTAGITGPLDIDEWEWDNDNSLPIQPVGYLCLDNTLADVNQQGTRIRLTNGLIENNYLRETTTTSSLTLPQGTIAVADCTNFPTSGYVYVTTQANGKQRVKYTGKTGSTALTGCTGGTGTYDNGAAVVMLVAGGDVVTIIEPTSGLGDAFNAFVHLESVYVAGPYPQSVDTYPTVQMMKSDGTAGTADYLTITLVHCTTPGRLLATDLDTFVSMGTTPFLTPFLHYAESSNANRTTPVRFYSPVSFHANVVPPTPPTGHVFIYNDAGVMKIKNSSGAVVTLDGSATFSMSATVKSPTADDFFVWRAPFACTLTNLRAYQDTGTGSVVNAFKGSLASPTLFRASAYTIAAADTIEDAGSLQNTSVAAGDKVYLRVTSVAGSPNELSIQLDFTRA